MPIPQGGTYDLSVYQGARFTVSFQLLEADGVTPMNLTGYTAVAQIRESPGAEAVMATFQTTVDGPTGTVSLTLPSATTGALKGPGEYDVFLTDAGGEAYLFVQGRVNLDRRVTR